MGAIVQLLRRHVPPDAHVALDADVLHLELGEVGRPPAKGRGSMWHVDVACGHVACGMWHVAVAMGAAPVVPVHLERVGLLAELDVQVDLRARAVIFCARCARAASAAKGRRCAHWCRTR